MKNIVITIGREYGSGGHEVGARLAERLEIPFYDEALVDLAAEKSGCCTEFIKKNDEKTPGIFARTSIMTKGNAYSHLTPEDDLFINQTAIINELAEKGACVIVGRCADYV
jgi:cytidylate kinase